MKAKAVINGWNIYCNEIAMILAGNTGILFVINHTYHSLSLECLLCKVKLVNSWTFTAFWENKSLAYIYFVAQLQGGGTLLQSCWWGVRRVSEDNVGFLDPISELTQSLVSYCRGNPTSVHKPKLFQTKISDPCT